VQPKNKKSVTLDRWFIPQSRVTVVHPEALTSFLILSFFGLSVTFSHAENASSFFSYGSYLGLLLLYTDDFFAFFITDAYDRLNSAHLYTSRLLFLYISLTLKILNATIGMNSARRSPITPISDCLNDCFFIDLLTRCLHSYGFTTKRKDRPCCKAMLQNSPFVQFDLVVLGLFLESRYSMVHWTLPPCVYSITYFFSFCNMANCKNFTSVFCTKGRKTTYCTKNTLHTVKSVI
jgi:hypothetical protein